MAAGYHVERYPHNLTRYTTLRHRGTTYNHNWYDCHNLVYDILYVTRVFLFWFLHRMADVERGKLRFTEDGLNSLKYHIKEVEPKSTFTRILVEFVPEEVSSKKCVAIFQKMAHFVYSYYLTR